MMKRLEKEEEKKKTPGLLKVILVIVILVFGCLYYMRFVETNRLVVNESKIESVKIPNSLSGCKLVHISDLYYMSVNDISYLKKLINKINRLKPDIVVFTGDLLDSTIDYSDDDLNGLIKYLNSIDANKKLFVKGDMDYNNKSDNILQDSGFESINNKEDVIYGSDKEKIIIHGLGSFLNDDFNLEDSFITNDENIFNIALFHEGDNILELKDKNIDLALAGHSLNNRVNIPFIKDIFRVSGSMDYYNNYYDVDGIHLYISSGIGTNGSKLRLFNPPTINLYRLVRKQ